MKAVLLLSGGIDSTVLFAALEAGGTEVIPITFDYGQMNYAQEIAAAKDVARHYGKVTDIFELPPQIFGRSALLGDMAVPAGHADAPDATVVPARNLVMLAIGSSVATRHEASAVFIGANLDDAAGYLDCRPAFIRAFDEAAGLGTGTVSVNAPYLSHTKADIIALGTALGAPLHLTWSCYEPGADGPCGQCGACLLKEGASGCPT